MINQPSPKNFLRWFDPRYKKTGSWAFILNRITALGLSLYLLLHLVMLGKLAQGPESYNAFITFAKSPVVKIGEMFVIAAGLFHGLNGIRIVLNSLGVGVRIQKPLFIGLMSLAMIGILGFAVIMFRD